MIKLRCSNSLTRGLFFYNSRNVMAKMLKPVWVLSRVFSTNDDICDKNGYFSKDNWPKNPYQIFKEWIEDANSKSKTKKGPVFLSMATVTPSHVPSIRMITFTDFSEKGLVFFTNYCSPKARELEQNPYCALHIWWPNRQIRIQGCVSKLSDELNVKNYKGMAPQNRIISHLRQSEPVKGKKEILQEVDGLLKKYKPLKEIPRSKYWGGYLVRPFSYEFFEIRTNLLHDRVQFLKEGHPLTDEGGCEYSGDDGWEYRWLTP